MDRRSFLTGLAGILSAGAAPWVHGTVSKAGLWTPKLIVPSDRWVMVTVTARNGSTRIVEWGTEFSADKQIYRRMMDDGLINGYCFTTSTYDACVDYARNIGASPY